ncbi:MAG TPA: GvpL/GvpF family gas vesicle protein [Candidatus Nitrosotalea sp.]|nr:GvpL/GvpF family gas vesicle protein [Candidatus Nitrosotalea sp.]
MKTFGKYIYCIMEGGKGENFGNIGLENNEVYTINHKDISAVVSKITFKEMPPDVDSIITHQKVVESSRSISTTLPVRFGIMFKTDEGVKQLLVKSYNDYKSKIGKLHGKEEFGIKVILEKTGMEKIQGKIRDGSKEIKKMQKEISKSGEGTSYFLKMRMDESIKHETLKKIDEMTGEIHQELASIVTDSTVLKSDVQEIVLNTAYLIDKDNISKFIDSVEKIKIKCKKDGFVIHQSGPWAPYSFC